MSDAPGRATPSTLPRVVRTGSNSPEFRPYEYRAPRPVSEIRRTEAAFRRALRG